MRLSICAVLAAALVLGCGESSIGGNSARGLLEKGQTDGAIVSAKGRLQRNDADHEARRVLADALLLKGAFAPALTEYDKLAKVGAEAANKRAMALLGVGRAADVVKQYAATELKDPKEQAELKTALAVAMLADPSTASAGEALLRATMDKSPLLGWTVLSVARLELAAGRVDEALALAERAIAIGDVKGEANHFKGAVLHRHKHDAAGAERAFQEAAKDARFVGTAGRSLVSVYLETQQLDKVQALLERLRKDAPEAHETSLVAAQLAYAQHDYPTAREALDRLLSAFPKDPGLLLFSGAVDTGLLAFDRAESQLGRAMQEPETAQEARRSLARLYLRMGDPDRALATIRPLLEGTPRAQDLSFAGDIHLQKAEPAQAHALFQRALERQPGDVALKTSLAVTEAGADRERLIRDLDRIALADATGDTADKALVSSLLASRRLDEALQAARRWAGKQPASADAALQVGMIQMQRGAVDEAKAEFEKVVAKDPSNYLATAQLARIDALRGDVAGARKRLDAMVAAHPGSLGARLTLARFLEATSAPPEQVTAVYTAAAKSLAQQPASHLALIGRLLRLGRKQEALASAQRAAVMFPSHPEVIEALGRAQAETGDLNQASASFGKLANLLPHSATPHKRMADVHVKQGQLDAARADLQRAFDAAPADPEVHARALALAQLSNSPAFPLSLARALKARAPDSALGYFLEGDAYGNRRQWPAALEAFRTALGKRAPDGAAPIRYFDALRVSGDKSGAEQFAATWIRDHPQDTGFVLHAANTALQAQQLDRAEAYYREALKSNPDSPMLLNNLAWALAQRGRPESVTLAERAVAKQPGSSAMLDTLAHALAATGKLEQGIETQRRALALSPNEPTVRLHLAQLLFKSGDRAGARRELEPLVQRPPRSPGWKDVEALQRQLGPGS